LRELHSRLQEHLMLMFLVVLQEKCSVTKRMRRGELYTT
jgi:hypothetical protein